MPELIRPATPADSEAIAALIGSLTHYFVADGSAPAAQPFLATFSPAAIAGLLCDGDYLCLCAEEQGQLLGVVTLHRPAHLHHLFNGFGHLFAVQQLPAHLLVVMVGDLPGLQLLPVLPPAYRPA